MVKCLFCKGESKLRIRIKNWKVYKCKNCGVSFLYPLIENAEKIYNQKYFEKWYIPFYEERKKYFEKLYLILKNSLPEKGKLLDIGCGIGIFLDLMREKGYDVYGQDVSPFAVDYCRSKNFIVFQELLNFKFENEFDIITMIDVIAHIKNPLIYLQKCKKLLKPDGILIIKTLLHSNYLFTIAKLFSFTKKSNSILHIPAQIYHFDKNSIIKLAEITGFKMEKIFIKGEFVGRKITFLNLWKAIVERSIILVLKNG